MSCNSGIGHLLKPMQDENVPPSLGHFLKGGSKTLERIPGQQCLFGRDGINRMVVLTQRDASLSSPRLVAPTAIDNDAACGLERVGADIGDIL